MVRYRFLKNQTFGFKSQNIYVNQNKYISENVFSDNLEI